MAKKLRVGIVGCGTVARSHVDAYDSDGSAPVVAVYDPVAKAAREFAQRTGARVAASVEEMARGDDLDVVSIASPPSLHLKTCRPFLEAKVAVYCEKPLELNARSAAKLAEAVKKSRTRFMMGFNHRFNAPVIELVKLLKGGRLGKPLLFRNVFSGWLSLKGNHRAEPKLSGGGCLIDHCSHSMDLFRYLVGEPTEVQAMAGNIAQKVPIEDFGMIHLSVRNKAFGEITASYSLTTPGNWIELHCTKGAAIVSYANEGHPDLVYSLDGGKWEGVDCSDRPIGRTAAICHLLECVRTNKKPANTVDDGLKAARIAEAVYKSVKQGRRVTMK